MKIDYTDVYEIVELAEQTDIRDDEDLLAEIDSKILNADTSALFSVEAYRQDGYLILEMVTGPDIEISSGGDNFSSTIQMRIAIDPLTSMAVFERATGLDRDEMEYLRGVHD